MTDKKTYLQSMSDVQLIEKLRAYEYSFIMQEAADRLERMQCQPIETAPKDGTTVLLYAPSWENVDPLSPPQGDDK